MRMKARLISSLALVASLPGTCLFSQTTSTSSFKFSAPHQISLGTVSRAGTVQFLASGDVNGDGNTDLLVTFGSTPQLLLGDGKGGFTTKPTNLLIDDFTNLAVVLLDVNGDGKADFIVGGGGSYDHDCNEFPGALSIYLGDGRGNFTLANSYPQNPATFFTIAVGDFNHDGKPDLATLNNPGGLECSSPNTDILSVLLNAGNGNFTGGYGAVIQNAFGLVTGDFDGDGRTDLAYWLPINSGANINTLNGNGDGSFRTGPSYLTDSSAFQLAAGNLNGDKRTDLVVDLAAKNTPGALPRTATLLAKQTGGFYWQSAVSSNPPFGQLSGLLDVLDLNGNGKLDLLMSFPSASSSRPFSITKAYAGNGTGTFGQAQTLVSQTAYVNPVALPLTKNGLPAIILFPATASTTLSIEVLLNESK